MSLRNPPNPQQPYQQQPSLRFSNNANRNNSIDQHDRSLHVTQKNRPAEENRNCLPVDFSELSLCLYFVIFTWIITPSALVDRSSVVIVVVVIGVVDVVVVAVAAAATTAAGTGGRAQMFLVSGSHVLEPDLSHPLGQSRQVGDTLKVLAVWVRVQQEIRLQHVQLLLCERRPHSFRLGSTASFRIRFYKKIKNKMLKFKLSSTSFLFFKILNG
jgi:hypothetical protein